MELETEPAEVEISLETLKQEAISLKCRYHMILEKQSRQGIAFPVTPRASLQLLMQVNAQPSTMLSSMLKKHPMVPVGGMLVKEVYSLQQARETIFVRASR